MTRERVTIMIKSDTKKRLNQLGTVEDTIDSVINKLLDHYHNYTINPRVKKK